MVKLYKKDIRPGLRLKSSIMGYGNELEFTVMGLTERGFKYDYDDDIPYLPREGLTIFAKGREHYLDYYNDNDPLPFQICDIPATQLEFNFNQNIC